MKPCFLGIDIGTSACKLALFGVGGTLYEHVVKNYPIHHSRPGYAKQDPTDWRHGVCSGLRALWGRGADPASIAAVGIGATCGTLGAGLLSQYLPLQCA